MTKAEKRQLKILLIKYQLIYFGIVLSLSLILLFGYSKIHFLLAQNLFKTNMNELLVQDFRTAILNLDQFVPSQFTAIDLVKDNQIILSIGSRDSSFFNFDTKFKTIDQTSLVFSSSYQLIFAIVIAFLILSFLVSRFINKYFTRSYEKQIFNQLKLQKSELMNEISKKVAHDIRSPLSTLNMLASLIENVEVREMQYAVTNQIDRIANDLLNYSKTQQDVIQPLQERLKSLFAQMQKEYSLKFKEINCGVRFEDRLTFDPILADVTLLYQNLNNFINNSLEAHAKNIHVIAEVEGNFICVKVSDDGVGMDEATLKKIGKTEFSTKSLSSSSSIVESGNGIALLNAYKAMGAKNWILNIHSELGLGTTISVKIPFT